MRKVLLLVVGAAVLWLPAVSVAGDSSSSPSRLAAKTETIHAESDVSAPARTCKSQRNDSNFAASHSGQAFTQFYGTNRGQGNGVGANAFGKCVSAMAKHKTNGDSNDSADSEESGDSNQDGSERHGNG